MYQSEKNKIIRFTINLYYIRAIVFLNCEYGFIYKHTIKLFGEHKAEKIATAQSSMIYTDALTGRFYSIIVINSCIDKAHFYSILQHEIFHMAANTMKLVGIKLTESSNEAYAYLIGNITQKIISKINQK